MYNVCCHTDTDHRLENTLQQRIEQIKKIGHGILTGQYIFPASPEQSLACPPKFSGVILRLWNAEIFVADQEMKSAQSVRQTNLMWHANVKIVIFCHWEPRFAPASSSLVLSLGSFVKQFACKANFEDMLFQLATVHSVITWHVAA